MSRCVCHSGMVNVSVSGFVARVNGGSVDLSGMRVALMKESTG